jgi:protein-S-isoprenylcysteine O-methyltransferase Ste14
MARRKDFSALDQFAPCGSPLSRFRLRHDCPTVARQRLAAVHRFEREVPVIFVLARATTYSALFIGLLLIFLPSRIVSATGIVRPSSVGVWQVAGILLGACGAALALACILTFVFVGSGTPAPFDSPRRLVVRGPYRLVRNPMYLGAGLALSGAALFNQSTALFGYAGLFLLVTHLFVVTYEEPTLRRTFKGEYEDYCRRTNRWRPKR